MSTSAMLSPKRLVEKAKRSGISLMRSNSRSSSCSDENTRVTADKGHFIVYSTDGIRFMVPLAFLKSQIFQEILRMSEEEFGLSGDGPITLVCNALLLEYILCLLYKHISGDMERALLASICASASLPCHLEEKQHQLALFTYR